MCVREEENELTTSKSGETFTPASSWVKYKTRRSLKIRGGRMCFEGQCFPSSHKMNHNLTGWIEWVNPSATIPVLLIPSVALAQTASAEWLRSQEWKLPLWFKWASTEKMCPHKKCALLACHSLRLNASVYEATQAVSTVKQGEGHSFWIQEKCEMTDTELEWISLC